MHYTILIADDEKDVTELLQLYLEKDGYFVFTAFDGAEALKIASSEVLDCAVLDIMMPKLNGFQLLKEIRKSNSVPVIMLTARIGTADKILGLDLGADDYITKPFDPLECVARIKAHIRRYRNLESADATDRTAVTELCAGNLLLDIQRCLLKRDKMEIELTSTEFHIMQLLMSHPGQVFTKEQIISAGWKETSYVEDNSIMVALSKLRPKLGSENLIKNIRGLGYRLEVGNA